MLPCACEEKQDARARSRRAVIRFQGGHAVAGQSRTLSSNLVRSKAFKTNLRCCSLAEDAASSPELPKSGRLLFWDDDSVSLSSTSAGSKPFVHALWPEVRTR
ncbi:hypothetical protein BRADI_1g45202v3 [Brachypodium distachyon]|uniref:Uncharacterized protein n=1 Tax=Brachypodium distachyon TaxID=15368 RepID=A0A2K2DPH4_BRADI|nr:hypothetical protein BRADI_1g45202v3 [Brachypodium distachyon]